MGNIEMWKRKKEMMEGEGRRKKKRCRRSEKKRGCRGHCRNDLWRGGKER